MIAPALPRWVAEVLDAEYTGVNALRTSVPRRTGEPAPPAVLVLNAMDDEATARAMAALEADPDLFILSVHVGEMEAEADPAAATGDGDTCLILVHLRGVATEAQNDELLVAVYRLLRCVRRALRHAFRQLKVQGDGVLQLEEQTIQPPATLAMRTMEPEQGSGAANVTLSLPFTMFDTWANTPIPET